MLVRNEIQRRAFSFHLKTGQIRQCWKMTNFDLEFKIELNTYYDEKNV